MFGQHLPMDMPKELIEDHPELSMQSIVTAYTSGYQDANSSEERDYYFFPADQEEYQEIYDVGYERGKKDREVRKSLTSRLDIEGAYKKNLRADRIERAVRFLNPKWLLIFLAILVGFLGYTQDAILLLLVSAAISLASIERR